MNKNKTVCPPRSEVIIGIVSPLGTKKELFKKLLKTNFKSHGIKVINLSVTHELIEIPITLNIPKSLEYFLKMQICSELRKTKSNGVLVNTIINSIKKERRKNTTKKTIVYLVDQLKNLGEYKLLSHIYGLNYIQMSLFSNEKERDQNLKERFESDAELEKKYDEKSLTSLIFNKIKIKGKLVNKFFSRKTVSNWAKNYLNEILSDSSHRLILKDFTEIDIELLDKKSGQQVSDLFHKSHYFINLDLPKSNIETEISKFVNLLTGQHKEYPTQDEFGMCLAYQASVRSNFPGGRHVGAAIISNQGEVISVASIRAPAKSSNPTRQDQNKVEPGYDKYYKKIDSWSNFIKSLTSIKKEKNNKIKLDAIAKKNLSDINKFLKSILDFHPCTHAEISAIIDAAKLGITVREAILYTTTFPCHLCAKDILNAGISRVVYLEAYPKSKNKELYPDLIDFDTNSKSEKTPFEFYCGIGPKRFLYAYSLDNQAKNKIIPLLQFELPKYYLQREKDVLLHFKCILSKNGCRKKKRLCELLHPNLSKK